MYGNLFLKHNIILNWECCLTVSLLQLHGMILLYEFLKETSILSAFEREEAVTIILRYLLNGTLSSSSMFLPTFPQQIMLPWQQNSQNRHFAFSCSKSRLRNWSSSCRAHCSGEQEPWYDFCLFLLLIFLVGAAGLGRTRVSLIIHEAGVSPPQSPEIFMMKLHNRGSRDHIEMLTWVSWSTLLLMSAPLYHLWTLSSAQFVWLDRCFFHTTFALHIGLLFLQNKPSKNACSGLASTKLILELRLKIVARWDRAHSPQVLTGSLQCLTRTILRHSMRHHFSLVSGNETLMWKSPKSLRDF